jgi:hypothetical protein
MSRPDRRRRYWNEPTLGWWERAYLFEILRGLSVTGGVFTRNLWRWMTGRKGALTTYYPEEVRKDFARHNRGKHVLTQRPTAARSASPATCAQPSARPAASRSRRSSTRG